ncbi:sigma-70 family RNA polymerase sigma factor [Caproiciproducens sp. NJN-50]|uniref:RNA polymerase sigma factor n=1 Tax=Acutalibacteraceae TaxID=3082771 RepID=UPI000FFE30BB|nr:MULTISPECIES: sigma-70 family RNA polymerase sigma factor [Acutalibacteraceae]QAT50442.1 sigma-70 family RNA polymerase sigma factor [Caproiciproducens sp. NJN-50]
MDELSLIVSAQKGEKEAFQSLITFYYPYVSKFILKVCGDVTLSEDLTQDTFLKLVRGIEKFDVHGKASFSTWVITIAKNCYLDHLRRNKREVLSLEEQDVSSLFSVQDVVLDRLLTDEILKALESLPPEQAAAIRLKYLEQLTLQEIARRFSCEPKTVKSRIHNGMVRLRKMLRGDFYHG